jgi:hypothetical protein
MKTNRKQTRSTQTSGDRCRCGKALPSVRDDETPYEFCSRACKQAARKQLTENTKGPKK